MIRTRKAGASEQTKVVTAIKEGMSYVWNSAVLRTIFILLIAINLLVTGPFEVGIPVLADRNLIEGATAFGILMSAYGGGALLGIILAGVLPKPKGALFGIVLLSVIGLLGIGMILLTISTSTPIVALISLAMGTTMGYVNINFMTWLQRRIPGHLMGRVMSLIMFASVGIAPVSSTLAGIILNVNLSLLFVGAGGLMAVVALAAATTRSVRQMGFEVAEVETKESIAEILRSSSELPALRGSGSMPAIRL
jgi:MFS family permease